MVKLQIAAMGTPFVSSSAVVAKEKKKRLPLESVFSLSFLGFCRNMLMQHGNKGDIQNFVFQSLYLRCTYLDRLFSGVNVLTRFKSLRVYIYRCELESCTPPQKKKKKASINNISAIQIAKAPPGSCRWPGRWHSVPSAV